MAGPGGRRMVALAAALVALMLLVGCYPRGNPNPKIEPVKPATEATAPAEADTAAMAGHQLVQITEDAFKPSSVTVKVGTRVVWNNASKGVRNVTLGDGGPSSGEIKPGGTASHVFDKAGTYKYFDALHPDVTGKIVVKKK